MAIKPVDSSSVKSEPMIAALRRSIAATIPILPLAFFFDQMSVLLRAGGSISDVFAQTAIYGGDPELRYISAQITPKLRNGMSLTGCLRPYESRFPEIVLSLLEVGEISGGLESSAARIAGMFMQTIEAERKFKFGVYDRRIFLVIFALVLLIHHVLQFLGASTQNIQPLPMAISIAKSIFLRVAELVAVFVVGRIVLRFLYRWHPFRIIVDTIKLALPGMGGIFRNLSAARWARSFATLWAAGINISAALDVSSRSTLNAHYESALRSAAISTRQGKSLTQCLTDIHMLPSHLLSIIHTSEVTGRLDVSLARVAMDMEKEAYLKGTEVMNNLMVTAQVALLVAAVAWS